MASLLSRVIALLVAFALLSKCALTKDRFRPMPIEGQTAEQTRKDQEESNDIALANKGRVSANPTTMAATGVAAGALTGAAIGAGFGGTVATVAVRGAAASGAVAGAALLTAAITEMERRGTEIYTECMQARGCRVGE